MSRLPRLSVPAFPLLVALLSSRGPCEVATPVVWNFESATLTWRPREDTIALTRTEGVGATEQSRACLRVQGKIAGGWNYATSDAQPMTAGRLYRLSAWVRVDRLGEATPAPFLKCEFVSEDGKGELGRIGTEPYDGSRTGQWQLLAAEFQAPADTARCWVALEKGGNTPMEIDAYLDDVRIEEIDKLTVFEKYRLNPVPPSLEKVRGVHPRLYLDATRVAELREAIKTTHAPLWEEVRAQADSAAKSGPPADRGDDGWSGNEQLWQRSVGNAMPPLALAYVLTGEAKYLDGARAWALASCGYKTWGLGSTDGMDLAAGHQLFGLAIVYDWCYDGLGDEARETIRDTLVKRTSAMFEAAATGKAWWQKSYLQNHLWVNICGMAAAGFALFDEVPEASLWVGLPLDKFRRTMECLGDDGASHEGAGYWQYGVEYMLKFLHLSGQLLDADIVGDGKWWRNTARYCQYLMIPRNAWTNRSSLVDLADCPRGNWYGPDYLLRGLAREYRDGHAQWLAQQLDDANLTSGEARWLNLIWYDPTVAPLPPTDLPTLRHFDDMDPVSARSDWSGDESLVVFKCGPYLGHKAVQEFTYDPGGGHVHPDANHFVLFGAGEWLLRDDGYRSKWTGQHNTLLIDGKGQLGEGQQWFNGSPLLKLKARPRVVRADSTPELDHLVGDATEAYPRDLGLKRLVRHLLFLKPNVLIVCDDIELDQARDLELRFHPEQAQAEQDGDAFLVRGKQSVLRIEPLTTDGVTVRAEDLAGEDRHGGKPFSMFTIRLSVKRAAWRNAVALSWGKAGEEAGKVSLRAVADRWTFTAGDHQARVDWSADPTQGQP
jgi:hypothetical protein